MLKKINYFLQACVVGFFIFGRILGLNLSRKIFSRLFSLIGPLFKSKKIITRNLSNFSKNISASKKKKLSEICGIIME